MNIPPDKIKHFVAGLIAAAAAAVAWFVAAQFGLVSGLHDAWLCALVASTVAGVTKEGADKLSNEIHPGTHGVEVADALATAAGALPVIALLALAPL